MPETQEKTFPLPFSQYLTAKKEAKKLFDECKKAEHVRLGLALIKGVLVKMAEDGHSYTTLNSLLGRIKTIHVAVDMSDIKTYIIEELDMTIHLGGGPDGPGDDYIKW